MRAFRSGHSEKSGKYFSGITLFICIYIFSGCEDRLFPDRSDDPAYIFDTFWQETDRHYSFFDHTQINWDSVYDAYRPMVNPATTETALFSMFDEILSLLNDAHANIYAPVGNGGNSNYFSAYPENPVVADPEGDYFDFYNNVNAMFAVARLKNSTLSYLRIKTFEGTNSDFEAIDAVLKELDWSTGLIIDVRSNFGGQISNSELVAGRFADTTRFAYEYRLRNGPEHSDFTQWYRVNLKAYSKTSWNKKPVAILTNRGSFSATEWFVLFMKLQPHVIIVGDTTGGGGAVPVTRELPNGWILRLSNTQTRLVSGRIFQRSGIYPDVPVWIKDEDEQNNTDTILETAIQLF